MDIIAFFLTLLYYTTTVLANDIKCNINVDITDGIYLDNSIIKNGLTYDVNNYYNEGNQIRGCICNIKKCIRKCCSESDVLDVSNKSCVSAINPASDAVTPYHIVHVPENEICDPEKFKVKIDKNFQVLDRGLSWDENVYSLEDYCVDKTEDASVAVLCATVEPEVDKVVLSIGMIISMPFLLVTFLVYAILPDPNLHRKALMFYVLTLLLSYICLVTVQLYDGKFQDFMCQSLGYSVVFFFIGSFFWMNVMCIDMWLAFSGLRGFNGQRHAERKRFIIYCIYAWGMPVLHILIILLINTYGDPETSAYPAVGRTKCFLDDGLPNLLYFYGPMAIITGVNIVLFILTAIKIRKVKRETSVLKHTDSKRHSYEDDKQKFNLYLKLLFAMGINWSMEIISWAIGWKMGNQIPSYVWYLTDFCNAMYGVFIFFIFVFKKKIWKSLQKRYYVFVGKPHLAHSLTTTQTTRSSNFSTTETGLNEHRLSEIRNGREERALTQN